MADSPNPYAPPTADEVFAPEIGEYTFQPSAGLSIALRWMLGISAGLVLISLGSDVMQLDLLGRMQSGGSWTNAEAVANDRRVGLLAVGRLLLLLATAIVWCVWQSRTSKNARALGAEFMEFGPNAWGWFACPVYNLWRPLQVINELWRVTSPADDGYDPPPSWFYAWWIPWLLASAAGQIATRLVSDTATLGQLIFSTQLSTVSDFLLAVSGVAAIAMIKQISQREHARAARLQS